MASFAWMMPLLFLVYLHSTLPCSMPPGYRYLTVAQQALIAPVIIQALVENTTNNQEGYYSTEYKACVKIEKILKGDKYVKSDQFCVGDFGPEELCLGIVEEGYSYVMFLNTDLSARYDVYHNAAFSVESANSVMEVKRSICNKNDNAGKNLPECIPPEISNNVKEFVRVNESSSLRLRCEASGTLPYITTWKVDGHENIYPARVLSDGDLFVEVMTPSLRGLYTCTVHNPAGSISKNISIEVTQSPCGGARNGDSKGIIETPRYPNPYPQDKMCVWRICPLKGRRLLFNFLDFDLRNTDKMEIINECSPNKPWRRYCGNGVPTSFVSRCRSTCVQISLASSNFYNSGARGIRISYEPTKEKRTRYGVKELFCESDFVVLAKVKNRFNRHVEVDIKQNFKGEIPVEISPSGSSEIKLFHNDPFTNAYGCRIYLELDDEYYFAGNIRDGVATIVHTFSEKNKEEMPNKLPRLLKKYKENSPGCKN